jgi:ABC transport system ATP-binding/permease protein
MAGSGGFVPALTVQAAGRTVALAGRVEWYVGRGSVADIQVPGQSVGRRHLVLRHTPDGWLLEDLGSLNGTWHNGVAVRWLLLDIGTLTVHLGGPQGVPVTVTVSPPDGPPPSGPVPHGPGPRPGSPGPVPNGPGPGPGGPGYYPWRDPGRSGW